MTTGSLAGERGLAVLNSHTIRRTQDLVKLGAFNYWSGSLLDEIQVNYTDHTVTFSTTRKSGTTELPGAQLKPVRTLAPGDIIGDNYRLMDLLGQGGMGVVYRCQHVVFGREYALKILAPDQVSEVSWKRFQLEGQAIAKLDHVSIVKIYNMGIDGQDCPYYVMELLEGHSLDDSINESGPLTVEEALPIFYQIAESLAYAHTKGVIHRDIKPSNIVLYEGRDGSIKIKVVDFGLAKVVKKDSFEKQSMTNAGEIFGTPNYMSPEQSLGEDVDGRADIYSLGCTLFKALTGKAPLRGANSFETMLLHQTQPAPFLCQASREQSFPEALEEMVHKMLEKNPDKRYQSMQQVCHDISRLMEGKSLGKEALGIKEVAVPIPGQLGRASKRGLLLVTVLSLASVGVGYFIVNAINKKQTYHPGDAAARRAIDTPVQTPLTTGLPGGREMYVAEKREHDENMDAAIVAFKKFEPKKTRHFIDNGKPFRTLYFPTVPVAEVEIPNQPYKSPGCDAVTVPDNCPILFLMHAATNRFTWANPWILQKLDPDGISNIILAQANFRILGDEDGGLDDLNEKRIIGLLKAMHDWHSISCLTLREFIITPAIFDELESLPHFDYLAIENSETSGDVFAGRKILGRLKGISLRGQIDVDGAMKNLPPSDCLERISLDRTVPSPASLRHLKAFPNLNNVSLEWTSISDEQIDALAELKGLRELHVEHCILSRKQVERFLQFTYLKLLIISNPGWSHEYCQKIKTIHPYACIFDHQVKNTDLEPPQEKP